MPKQSETEGPMTNGDMIRQTAMKIAVELEVHEAMGTTTKAKADVIEAAIRALPVHPVRVKPGKIERAVWSAMIWAASNNPGFDDLPEYTDYGNSFAETEARATAARILAAILSRPPLRQPALPPDRQSAPDCGCDCGAVFVCWRCGGLWVVV